MADLEEIKQKILLDGDAEVIGKLKEIGEGGFEAFNQIVEAAESGTSTLELFGTALGLVAAAVIGLTGAMLSFVEANDEAIQKTNLLASAFGATTAQITGLEAAFSQAGVTTKEFENFAQRLTTTIAREWPQITESVRTSATQQDEAQQRMVSSTIKVQEAQNNLAEITERTSLQINAANQRVEASAQALALGAQRAYQTMEHDIQSVASANLSLEQAQQRLDVLQGKPVSEADKQALALKQAQLAVDQARQAATDALLAQQQHQQEAALKQAQLEQAAAEARQRQSNLAAEAALTRQKAELQLREAISSRDAAEERAAQTALKSIPTIKAAIDGVISGNKAMSQAIDLTQVSVQNLVKGLILAASTGGKPTGLQVLIEVSRLLSSEQGKLIDSSQRLAIVQTLSQRGFNTTGQSAFELLKVLEKGPETLTKYTDAAQKNFASSAEAAHNVDHFKDALTSLAFSIDLVNRNFAAAASPVFSHLLEAINKSLTDSGGLLHAFVDGVKAIGVAIDFLIEKGTELFHSIDKAFDLAPGRSFQVFLGAITVLVAAFASAWLAIPALIAVVVTAIGYIAENWDKVKTAFNGWVDSVKSSPLFKLLDSIIEKIKAAYDWWTKLGTKQAVPNSAANPDNPARQATENPQNGTPDGLQAFAGGGHVRGPGTSTSDSIAARLSDGEFVHREAAVRKYGASFMHAINNLELPGFAMGGMVGSPVRLAGVSSAGGPQHTLNLTIGDQTFNGLRAPASTADALSRFALGRQTSSAGRQPSWKS